jgi:soluble lytic murein transglycosylase
VTEAEAWQGVRHRATARGTDGPPRRRRPSASAPARRIEAALYHVFARLDAPYLANRFASRLEGRPRLRLARPFGRWVRARAPENGLAPGRLWAVMTVESAWCPRVVSSAGAVGLLQLMPITARRVARARGLRGFHLARLFEPATSIGFGAWYLGQLLRRFDGQYPLAVAAYNGGPHNVAAWVRRKAHRCALDELVEEIPFRETRLYVKKVTALAARYAIELGEPYADLLRLRVDATIGNNIDF